MPLVIKNKHYRGLPPRIFRVCNAPRPAMPLTPFRYVTPKKLNSPHWLDAGDGSLKRKTSRASQLCSQVYCYLYSQSTITNIGEITLIEQVKGKDAICKTPTQHRPIPYMTLYASPTHHTLTIAEGKKGIQFWQV